MPEIPMRSKVQRRADRFNRHAVFGVVLASLVAAVGCVYGPYDPDTTSSRACYLFLVPIGSVPAEPAGEWELAVDSPRLSGFAVSLVMDGPGSESLPSPPDVQAELTMTLNGVELATERRLLSSYTTGPSDDGVHMRQWYIPFHGNIKRGDRLAIRVKKDACADERYKDVRLIFRMADCRSPYFALDDLR